MLFGIASIAIGAFFVFPLLRKIRFKEDSASESESLERKSPLPLKSLKDYRQEYGFITKEEFDEIRKFISRVQFIEPQEPVTENDFRMFQKFEFQAFLDLINLLEIVQTPQKGNKIFCPNEVFLWEDVTDACSRISNVKFGDLLNFLYNLDSIESLTRNEMLEYYHLFDFLQASSKPCVVETLVFLDSVFPVVQLSPDEMKGKSLKSELPFIITNRELQILATKAVFTPLIMAFDTEKLFKISSDRLDVILKLIFAYYLENGGKNFGFLEKVKIVSLSFWPQFVDLLQRNSANLTSLSISKSYIWPEEAIRFSNLTEFTSDNKTGCAKFEFSKNSNFTVFEFNELTFSHDSDSSSFWKMCYMGYSIKSLVQFIESNKNIEHLNIKLDYQNSDSCQRELKAAISSLKFLDSLTLRLSQEVDLEGYFNPDNSITSLTLIIWDLTINWKYFQGVFKNLKHLTYNPVIFQDPEGFVEFIRNSNLEAISLNGLNSSIDMNGFERIFKAINENKTLRNFETSILTLEKIQPILAVKFEAVFVQLLCRTVKEASEPNDASFLFFQKHFPSGAGVKYLCFKGNFDEHKEITNEHLIFLGQKFPALQVLFLFRSEFKCTIEIPFEIVCIDSLLEVEFFKSLPHAFFGEFNQ